MFDRYVIGFVWFVLSLVKRYYMRQFSLFAWTHVALLIVVTQSYLIIQVTCLPNPCYLIAYLYSVYRVVVRNW